MNPSDGLLQAGAADDVALPGRTLAELVGEAILDAVTTLEVVDATPDAERPEPVRQPGAVIRVRPCAVLTTAADGVIDFRYGHALAAHGDRLLLARGEGAERAGLGALFALVA